MHLTTQQIAILERLRSRHYEIVAFERYANHIGVRKGNCAALLAPVADAGFAIFGRAFYLIAGNFAVRVTDGGRDWFVWKKDRLEATPARLAELDAFFAELSSALLPAA